MKRKHQFAVLGFYVTFLAILASANNMPVIYTYHTWTRDIYLMWVLLGISSVVFFSTSLFLDKAKWLTLITIAPLVTLSSVKFGYLAWWGYYGSYLNNIGAAILINIIAITAYTLIAIALFKMWQPITIAIILLTVSMVPVTYSEATAVYESATNNSFNPDGAQNAPPG